jgi:hypothetical protein
MKVKEALSKCIVQNLKTNLTYPPVSIVCFKCLFQLPPPLGGWVNEAAEFGL